MVVLQRRKSHAHGLGQSFLEVSPEIEQAERLEEHGFLQSFGGDNGGIDRSPVRIMTSVSTKRTTSTWNGIKSSLRSRNRSSLHAPSAPFAPSSSKRQSTTSKRSNPTGTPGSGKRPQSVALSVSSSSPVLRQSTNHDPRRGSNASSRAPTFIQRTSIALSSRGSMSYSLERDWDAMGGGFMGRDTLPVSHMNSSSSREHNSLRTNMLSPRTSLSFATTSVEVSRPSTPVQHPPNSTLLKRTKSFFSSHHHSRSRSTSSDHRKNTASPIPSTEKEVPVHIPGHRISKSTSVSRQIFDQRFFQRNEPHSRPTTSASAKESLYVPQTSIVMSGPTSSAPAYSSLLNSTAALEVSSQGPHENATSVGGSASIARSRSSPSLDFTFDLVVPRVVLPSLTMEELLKEGDRKAATAREGSGKRKKRKKRQVDTMTDEREREDISTLATLEDGDGGEKERKDGGEERKDHPNSHGPNELYVKETERPSREHSRPTLGIVPPPIAMGQVYAYDGFLTEEASESVRTTPTINSSSQSETSTERTQTSLMTNSTVPTMDIDVGMGERERDKEREKEMLDFLTKPLPPTPRKEGFSNPSSPSNALFSNGIGQRNSTGYGYANWAASKNLNRLSTASSSYNNQWRYSTCSIPVQRSSSNGSEDYLSCMSHATQGTFGTHVPTTQTQGQQSGNMDFVYDLRYSRRDSRMESQISKEVRRESQVITMNVNSNANGSHQSDTVGEKDTPRADIRNSNESQRVTLAETAMGEGGRSGVAAGRQKVEEGVADDFRMSLAMRVKLMRSRGERISLTETEDSNVGIEEGQDVVGLGIEGTALGSINEKDEYIQSRDGNLIVKGGEEKDDEGEEEKKSRISKRASLADLKSSSSLGIQKFAKGLKRMSSESSLSSHKSHPTPQMGS